MSNPLQALNQSKAKTVLLLQSLSSLSTFSLSGPDHILPAALPLTPLYLKLLLLVTQTLGAVPDEKSSS